MSEDIDKILAPYKSGIYIDCTFGGGGITRKILSKKNTRVLGSVPAGGSCGLSVVGLGYVPVMDN